MRIISAEAWLCRLPMPWPVRLGPMVYPTRDYVVLKLTADNGLEGWAIGYTRGTPLFDGAHMLAANLPSVLEGPEALCGTWRRQFAPGWAALVRAISLYDICVWDLTSKYEGQPLGAALGGLPRDLPLMGVAGYFIDDRGVAGVVDEAVRFAAEGFTVVKIMLPGHERTTDEHLIHSVRDALPQGCHVAVDLHGMFQTTAESMEYSEWLNSMGVAFIEDPFASSQWREVAAFQERTSIPVASGEDLAGLGAFLDLMDSGVQRIRLDATASGGITGALDVLSAAASRPVGILPHVWPHLHAHLGAITDQIPFVEVIPDYVGADPMWALLDVGPTCSAGHWQAATGPGIGMTIDTDSLEHHARAHWQVPVQTVLSQRNHPTSFKEQ